MDPKTRIDPNFSLEEVVRESAKEFILGSVSSFSIIQTGYQECNLDVTASNGRFVLKIFASDKSKSRVQDVVWGYARFPNLGVPLPNLRHTATGKTVVEYSKDTHRVFIAAFGYITGKPLTHTSATDDDIVILTRAMAGIHTTVKTIDRYYDTLGITNVATEFEKNRDALFPDESSLLLPIIAKFRKLDLTPFHHSVIHGTMEKENVLKNSEGKLYLLDLGCMDYNASILDIATFIANFSVYLPQVKRNHLIHLVLTTYTTILPLAPVEIAALPTLIRAQFAAYIIGMTYNMRKNHDMSKQTQVWLDRGWDGLRAYTNIKSLI